MKEKIIVRLLMPPLMVAVCALWIVIGLFSVHRLGKVMEQTGKNLQAYLW